MDDGSHAEVSSTPTDVDDGSATGGTTASTGPATSGATGAATLPTDAPAGGDAAPTPGSAGEAASGGVDAPPEAMDGGPATSGAPVPIGGTDGSPSVGRPGGDDLHSRAVAGGTAVDAPGVLRSIQTGRVVGRTASLEASFVAQARARAREHACYAVVGPDSSEAFVAAVREVCPVLVDELARDVALLIDGKPSEWSVGDAA